MDLALFLLALALLFNIQPIMLAILYCFSIRQIRLMAATLPEADREQWIKKELESLKMSVHEATKD